MTPVRIDEQRPPYESSFYAHGYAARPYHAHGHVALEFLEFLVLDVKALHPAAGDAWHAARSRMARRWLSSEQCCGGCWRANEYYGMICILVS